MDEEERNRETFHFTTLGRLDRAMRALQAQGLLHLMPVDDVEYWRALGAADRMLDRLKR